MQKGHPMMVRNLILAGASVHDKTPSQQTALQLASETNLAEVCSILLSEGIDFSAADSRYVNHFFITQNFRKTSFKHNTKTGHIKNYFNES